MTNIISELQERNKELLNEIESLKKQLVNKDQEYRCLAEIVFEKINFGMQFQIHNTFYIKGHQKTT